MTSTVEKRQSTQKVCINNTSWQHAGFGSYQRLYMYTYRSFATIDLQYC